MNLYVEWSLLCKMVWKNQIEIFSFWIGVKTEYGNGIQDLNYGFFLYYNIKRKHTTDKGDFLCFHMGLFG